MDHLEQVGRIAGQIASKWGAPEWGRLAGLWHDLGKYSVDFQTYIRAATTTSDREDAHVESESDTASPARRVDHSSAGAILTSERWGVAGHMLGLAIAGHHSGLTDHPAFKERIAKKRDLLAAALLDLEARALTEQGPPSTPPLASRRDSNDRMRQLEVFTRFLFSALCDADFIDTEAFFEPAAADYRLWPEAWAVSSLCDRLTNYLDHLQEHAPASVVNDVRRDVRAACADAAQHAPGVFSLTVPTGGGKTLASMEFALRHARAHGMRGVVVAIPFTSIIEQSAAVYARAFGYEDDPVGSPVLEHHSAFDPAKETNRTRLAAQNWDFPVVVTTSVQLFESLFANRTSRCRKLHNLARSVIVLDEVQSLPRHLLEPIVDMLETLVSDYGASVVLCTATQPALLKERLGRFGFERVTEIVPSTLNAFERLVRVKVRWPDSAEPVTWTELAAELATERDVLAVVHRRNDARELCEELDRHLGDRSTVHLSALMCGQHRSHCIADIKQRKARGEAVRAVSTQLVEAGVDLDFAVVYRSLGGMDSLAQAAGRCNREGRLAGLGELRVFRAPTLPPRGILEQGLRVSEGLLRANPLLDLFAPTTHLKYFEQLYAAGSTDRNEIQGLRAEWMFKAVAASFQMIEDDWSAAVVVPYGKALALLAKLERLGPSRGRLRALQRFTVNVPKKLVAEWLRTGAARLVGEGGMVTAVTDLSGRAYDPRFGLLLDRVGDTAPDALIVDG